MLRDTSAARLAEVAQWDLVIIGGGAAGLGCALAATQRGLNTLLLEKGDFACGTSSRSSKMIHGGVRYLKQGDLPMVRLSLREREHLLRTAPSLVKEQEFIIPVYKYSDSAVYTLGMRFYGILARRWGSTGRFLNAEAVAAELPGINQQNLKGGVVYSDGIFDDARFAITLAYAAAKAGATLINYAPVIDLIKDAKGRLTAVKLRDLENNSEHEVACRCVINAAGTFADAVRALAEPRTKPLQTISQGSHLVLPRSFLGTDALTKGMMIPRTDDGRVLFCLPWHDRLLVGTTDMPVAKADVRPRPRAKEIDFILRACATYLANPPRKEDILSAFAGQRALPGAATEGQTKDMSREHRVDLSPSGLISILGGKWTTYRVTAAEALDQAALVLGDTSLAHARDDASALESAAQELAKHLADLYTEDAQHREVIHPRLPYTRGDVVRALRYEMARTLSDVLATRTRSVLLDREGALECAPALARLMADQLHYDDRWIEQQLQEFRQDAATYGAPD